jgi:hypothetical protein
MVSKKTTREMELLLVSLVWTKLFFFPNFCGLQPTASHGMLIHGHRYHILGAQSINMA